MNKKFFIASLVSTSLKVIGWMLGVIGFFGFLYTFATGIIESSRQGNILGMLNIVYTAQWVGISMSAFISGLGTLAFGEVIGVLIAIEANTRTEHTVTN